jgi:hypothetical protein
MPKSSHPETRPESRFQYTNKQFLLRKTLKKKKKKKATTTKKKKICYFRGMTLLQWLLGS